MEISSKVYTPRPPLLPLLAPTPHFFLDRLLEWYVRVDEVTWKNLNKYAQKIGTATLGSAIARLLKSELE